MSCSRLRLSMCKSVLIVSRFSVYIIGRNIGRMYLMYSIDEEKPSVMEART